jgi:transcriptional regulator with XRE-family HTH domain
MSPEEFQTKTLQQLALATGVNKSRWSRYLRRRVWPTERTLQRAAEGLKMTIPELLQAMEIRRRSLSAK